MELLSHSHAAKKPISPVDEAGRNVGSAFERLLKCKPLLMLLVIGYVVLVVAARWLWPSTFMELLGR
jgi:hypothetical protein